MTLSQKIRGSLINFIVRYIANPLASKDIFLFFTTSVYKKGNVTKAKNEFLLRSLKSLYNQIIWESEAEQFKRAIEELIKDKEAEHAIAQA